ncbi:hypothetical protein D3C74_131790 [compost metagenome]
MKEDESVMKFELDSLEDSAVRIALVRLIEEYEEVFSYQVGDADKGYWSRQLDVSKSAFKKIFGETIEDYRVRIEKSTSGHMKP